MKYIIVFFLFYSVATVSYAEDMTISADVDRREVTLDEQTTLTITVSGNASNIPQPYIPGLNGFTAYSSGRSQNISIVNGQISSSVTFTYILVPNNTGDYALGPFNINYKGKTYSADPINIKVLPRNSQPSMPSQQQQAQPSDPGSIDQNSQPQQGKELFIEAYVDKLRAYVNEQITLTFAVYQAVNLFNNPLYNPPSTTGFWAEDMPPQKKYYKVIDGTRYLVTEIKTALFATGQGEFTIGSARLEATVEDVDKVASRNPFDAFDQDPFSMFRRGKPIALTTEPIKVEILPLPEQNKPADFKGDVGDFDISLNVDKNTVEENQPVSLKIKIKGKGNIKTVSSPIVPEIQDVKFYESGSSENISKDNYIVQGEKIFEKMIIPKKEGNISLGPVEYIYFDTVMKDYVRKKLAPVIINVTKSIDTQAEKNIFTPAATKEEIQLLKRDIGYIKTSHAEFRPKKAFLYKNIMFLLINILLFFILIGLYLYELYRSRLRTDIGYARSLRARNAASKRLKGARKTITKNMVKEFYTEIYKAVIEYIADKLNIPHPSITKDSLAYKLKEVGVSEDIIDKVKTLFDDCDMARFASARFAKLDMERTIKQAESIITNLERYI
ncbi:MAG: BatD family protein [Candidatus Omnitrophica bacterium]|nr:BatD family protein [Candidatus Omnitrophota bacterium]